mgnify:CR=1 FL=1
MTEQMLRQYTVLVEYLGATLGPDYEVVLHEILPETSRVAAIVNGTISGRSVGAPITNAALRMIMQKQYETSDYNLNYTGQLANGKTIRSSTMFIKDGGKLVGLLCINFDDSRYRDVCDRILSLCHPDLFVTDVLAQPLPENEDGVSARSSPEKFRNSADAVALDAINRELERMGVTPGHLTHSERLQVITSLESAGIFLLKGAIKSAAAALGCSTASIYRYLSQINPSD